MACDAFQAAIPHVFAQETGKRGKGKVYERGPVRIYYEEAGSGFPLLLIPGGGLNSTTSALANPFNAIEEFKGEYHCIAADLRNAPSGQSTGPVEVDRPWESYADDQLGLMDHLGIDKFMVMGFCIGGPFVWSLLRRAPERIAGAVVAQPVGWRPEMRDPKYPGAFWKGWPAQITMKRPEIPLPQAEQFTIRMFETNPDFVFTVTREFVRSCQNPVLIPPDPNRRRGPPYRSGRRPSAPISPRHGVRNARSASGSQHISVERAKGTDSAGSAPNSFLPPGAPARLGPSIRTATIRQAAVI